MPFSVLDDRLWPTSRQPGDRQALLQAIDGSLGYLQTRRAALIYRRQFAQTGISRARVRRSLRRFSALLQAARSPVQFQAALRREFVLQPWPAPSITQPVVQPVGPVAFTGYYEPLYEASLTPSSTYRYPLFRLPARFSDWPRPHPARAELEGRDGLHLSPLLRGSALVWLRDRLEAFLVQVEGTARLHLPDGQVMTVGYAGHTAWRYTSIGRELVKDGKIQFKDLTQQAVIAYFRAHPAALDAYLPRNPRMVFFRLTHGASPSGSLGAPLTAERSIATDQALRPPGALAFVQIAVANPYAVRVLGTHVLARYVLDQDAGDAIKGPARVDVFTGTGNAAGERAGVINAPGQLWYVLLKP